MLGAQVFCSVSTVALTPADDQKKFRAFVSLKPDRYTIEGGGYRAFVRTMTDGDMRAQLLADALEELEIVRAKYAELTELAEIFASIDRVAAPKVARKPRSRKYRQPEVTV